MSPRTRTRLHCCAFALFCADLGQDSKVEPPRSTVGPVRRFRRSGAVRMGDSTELAVMGAPPPLLSHVRALFVLLGQMRSIGHLTEAVGAGMRARAWSEAFAAARAHVLSICMLCSHVGSAIWDVAVCCRTHVANAWMGCFAALCTREPVVRAS